MNSIKFFTILVRFDEQNALSGRLVRYHTNALLLLLFQLENNATSAKKCGCFYSVEKKSTTKTPEQKRLALQLYLEGMGFRAIGRMLNISYGTVFQWIKKWSELAVLPTNEKPIEVVELDEIHTYIQYKKTTAGSGLLLIDFGNASSILFVEKGIQ